MSARSIPRRAVVVTKSDTNYITDVVRTNAGDEATADSVTVASDLITKASHGYSNGDTLQFRSLGTVTGIDLTTSYFIVGVTTDTFQVSLTKGGSAVDLTGANTTPPSWLRTSKLVTARVTGCLYVGTSGDVTVLPVDHDDTNTATPAAGGAVLFKAVPAGTFLPVEVKKVFNSGTSADLVCVYDQL